MIFPMSAPRFFTAHQAAVVQDATARIAPGPGDDPAEAGHPGAREAGVTGYIDLMLGALDALDRDEDPPPMIFAGGARSSVRSFVRLDPVARIAWRGRLADWRERYTRGIALVDSMAGGDFTAVSAEEQDTILAKQEVSEFTSLMFEHTIEGMYAGPEYGGNRGLAGWKDIGFPGDVQPEGYSAQEVERSDGYDPVLSTPIVTDVLGLLGVLGEL
jgi:gluconate 2-dehydrogenase gamma chain